MRWVIELVGLLMGFCARGDGGVLFTENAYYASGYRIVNNCLIILADDV